MEDFIILILNISIYWNLQIQRCYFFSLCKILSPLLSTRHWNTYSSTVSVEDTVSFIWHPVVIHMDIWFTPGVFLSFLSVFYIYLPFFFRFKLLFVFRCIIRVVVKIVSYLYLCICVVSVWQFPLLILINNFSSTIFIDRYHFQYATFVIGILSVSLIKLHSVLYKILFFIITYVSLKIKTLLFSPKIIIAVTVLLWNKSWQ